jgi:hypothetical protein
MPYINPALISGYNAFRKVLTENGADVFYVELIPLKRFDWSETPQKTGYETRLPSSL